ncbi:MAG: NAD-dependent epimerase/dehydratase family protein [Myxococcota bacterium]
MRVAITGVSGYLGSLLAERLVAEGIRGADLVGIDRLGSHLPASRMRYVRRDVTDPRLHRDLSGCDVVVHMAAVVETPRDPRRSYEVNVGGTRSVLEACERAAVPNVVMASSIAAYGVQGTRILHEDTPLQGGPESLYGHTKRLAEEQLDLFEERNRNVRVARLRPSVVLGPRYRGWAEEALREAGRLDVPRGLRLPIIHEADVVEAFWRAIAQPVRGAFLVARREPVTGADMAGLLSRRRVVVPERVLLGLVDARFALGLSPLGRDFVVLAARNDYRCNPSRTERELDWQPSRPAEEAVRAVFGPPGGARRPVAA